MSKHNQRKRTYAAPVTTALDGTIIGRMDDLQKQFSDMRNAIDMSDKSPAFIQAGISGLMAARRQGPVTVSTDDPFDQTGQFTPGRPNLPANSEERPRQFAYTPGTNLTWIPRWGYGIVDYGTLRALGFASKEIRLNFELAKRTLRGLGHEITQVDKLVGNYGTTYKAVPPNYDDVIRFWKYPDGYHCFDDWVDLILEDALVCGASAIYKEPDPTLTKTAQPIDVTTWRILTDLHGRIPEHPAPAFIQTTYGRASFWCSRNHLLHSPLHPTINNPYGYSATEFIIQSTVQSIKRDSSRTGAFTDGNVPAAFVGLPTAWSPSQIKDFTDWFNSLIRGDVNRSNKIMFIPHDGQGIPVSPFSGIDQNQTGLDEWLLKTAAWAVGNNPAEFGLTSGSGLGGKGALDAGENAQFRGSTAVYTQYISRIVEAISRELLDAPWVKSTWQGMKPPEDDVKESQVEAARIASGVWSVKYVQDKLGYDRKKYAVEEIPASAAPVTPGSAPESLPAQGEQIPAQAVETQKQPEYRALKPAVIVPENFERIAARAAEADLLAWRDKARYAVQKGSPQPGFNSVAIPDNLKKGIENFIDSHPSRLKIDEAFSLAIAHVRTKGMVIPVSILSKSSLSELDQALGDLEALVTT